VETTQRTTSKIESSAALNKIWIESVSFKFVDAKCAGEKAAFIHALFEFDYERAGKRSFSKDHNL
jgi:hypothetical protein